MRLCNLLGVSFDTSTRADRLKAHQMTRAVYSPKPSPSRNPSALRFSPGANARSPMSTDGTTTGTGHPPARCTSFAQNASANPASAPSACAAKHIRAYFEDGTVPPEGTVCDPDVLPIVGAAPGAEGKRALSGEEDKALQDALKLIRGRVPMLGYSRRFQ